MVGEALVTSRVAGGEAGGHKGLPYHSTVPDQAAWSKPRRERMRLGMADTAISISAGAAALP